MVLQGPCDDVVTQVEDKEADDEQRAHTAPHGLPVPVQSVSSHSLKVAFESVWRWGEKAWIIHAVGARQSRPHLLVCSGRFCAGHH